VDNNKPDSKRGKKIDADSTSPSHKKREPSQARMDANRKNAQRSTGPRTEAGKLTSSMNALKHGGFVSALKPLTRGPFKEDAEALEGFLSQVAADLDPPDVLGQVFAMGVARTAQALQRLEVFSAEELDGAWTLSPAEEREVGGPQSAIESRVRSLGMLLGWSLRADAYPPAETSPGPSSGETPLSDITYMALAGALIAELQAGDVGFDLEAVPGPDAATPAGEHRYEQFYRSVVRHALPDRQLMDVWLKESILALDAKLATYLVQSRALGTAKALAQIERASRVRARLTADLTRELWSYRALTALDDDELT
jgi:hypothetical protein